MFDNFTKTEIIHKLSSLFWTVISWVVNFSFKALDLTCFIEIPSFKVITPLFFILILFLCGCIPVSTESIQSERQKYNVAIQKTSQEQLLLNIVRLRYADTAFFLSVNGVTSSYSLSLSGSLSLSESWDSQGNESKSLGLSGSSSSSFSPVLTYQPIQGEDYVKRLLTPISLNGVYQLLRSGWSIARIFRGTMQLLNGMPNAISAGRPTAKHAPKFKDFIDSTYALRRLQIDEDPIFEFSQVQSHNLFLIKFPGSIPIPPKDRPLLEKIGYDFTTNSLLLTDEDVAVEVNKRRAIPIQTRTFLSIMYYCSKSVDVPAEHYQQGLVERTTNEDGTCFDWTADVTRGILAIKSSKTLPKNSLVEIQYKDYWFYIADNDVDSKETFSLLLQLADFQQETGAVATPFAVPALTIGLH